MRNESGLLPMEFNVVVKPDPIEEKTAGGIYLPGTKTDRDKLAADEGTLVAVGALAFTYADWPEGARQPQPGDRVIFARHSGTLRDCGGTDFRIIKDKDIVAVVDTTPALSVAA